MLEKAIFSIVVFVVGILVAGITNSTKDRVREVKRANSPEEVHKLSFSLDASLRKNG